MLPRAARSDPGLEAPPRPPLVLRIGVVGHRPNRLGAAEVPLLAARLREIIHAVRDEVLAHLGDNPELYADRAPVVRALSPLAEGTDRLFAEQALAEGCELTVVMPFHQAEFENDFAPPHALEPDSITAFRRLLARAETVFELDGSRADESRAYQIAGDVVLNQSDVLIVVWDGERRNLRGGTEETFDDAVERGVPLVWIDARAPHHWRIVRQPIRLLEGIRPGVRAVLMRSQSLDAVREQVRRLVGCPSSFSGGDAVSERGKLGIFLSERQPRYNLAFWWKWFRNVVGEGRCAFPGIRVMPYETEVEAKWPRDRSHPVAMLIDRLRPYYAWADKLADRYADGYRSAFVVAFCLAAIAVAMALAPLALQLPEHSLGETLSTLAELMAIGLILAIVVGGRRGDWHRRWLDYRLLAEILRHQRIAAPLGGIRASPSVPEHWAGYGEIAASWMAWYARAVERSLGLPTAVVDRRYLEVCLYDLYQQLGGPHGQVQFHATTSARSGRIEHRLHRLELALFGATLLCCLQHILQGVLPFWPQAPSRLLTFFCASFPAFGAALAGISNQGEFRRIAQRSRSMSDRLQQQLREVESLQQRLSSPTDGTVQLSADTSRVASDTARMMVNEVLDWRVIFQDRPLRTT